MNRIIDATRPYLNNFKDIGVMVTAGVLLYKAWTVEDLIRNNQRLTDTKIDAILAELRGLAFRMDGQSAEFRGLASEFRGLASKLDGLSSRVDGLSSRVDGLSSRVDGLSSRVDTLCTWIERLDSDLQNAPFPTNNAISVDNPAAKILVDMSRVQDDEVGDGTTSVTVLASELLCEAEKLIEKKLHPQIIIDGYRLAVNVACNTLTKCVENHSKNEGAFKEDLLNIARKTLSSKILCQHKDFFANLAVDAIFRLKGSGELSAIQIIKKNGGVLEDSFLDEEFLSKDKSCAIVICGATQQIIDEAERSLHDALCVLAATVKESHIIYGGGCSETLMAVAILKVAAETSGKESIAMESFARALLQLPTTIADNAGYDSAALVAELRAAHVQGKQSSGLNMDEGKVECMKKLGITESFVVKRQVLVSAAKAAEMILQVNNIFQASPRERAHDRGMC